MSAQERLDNLLEKQKDQEDEREILLKELEELKLTIARLDESIAATKQEYTRIYNEELSPVHSLPAEITHIIFSNASSVRSGVEIKLSQVCRTWRSLALASPDLWSRIIITFSDATQMAEESHYHRFLAYLARSQDWPLNIRFDIHPLQWSKKLAPMLMRFLNVAVSHSLRWRRLSMEMIPPRSPFAVDWDQRNLLQILEGVLAPSLEFFEAVLPSSFHFFPDRNLKNFRTFFGGTIWRLRLVRMDSITFMQSTPPLSNITTLQLENCVMNSGQIDFGKFLDLLDSTSSSLVNLVIGSGVFDTMYVKPVSVHRASAAKLKRLFCADQSVAENLWLMVDAPSLELLIFRGVWFDPFVEFFETSSDGRSYANVLPSLKTLGLIDCVFDSPLGDNPALPLAHATEGIIYLHIYGGTIAASTERSERFLVPKLGQNNLATMFWPNLQRFACSLSEVGEVTAEDYQAFLHQVQLRTKILKAPTILQLCRGDADQWAMIHPESWDALVSEGHFEELAVEPRKIRNNPLCCFPWPVPSYRELWKSP